MSKIVKKLLLTGDKFFAQNAFKTAQGLNVVFVAHSLKMKNRIRKIKERGDSRYIYQNELDKACFQHDIAYGDFKDLNRRTIADKVLRDKAFNIDKNHKYDGYQRELASMVYKFLIKNPLHL